MFTYILTVSFIMITALLVVLKCGFNNFCKTFLSIKLHLPLPCFYTEIDIYGDFIHIFNLKLNYFRLMVAFYCDIKKIS